jgi:hypothetical protein
MEAQALGQKHLMIMSLAKLGYKQELRREFSPVEVFGIGFSIIGVIPSVA